MKSTRPISRVWTLSRNPPAIVVQRFTIRLLLSRDHKRQFRTDDEQMDEYLLVRFLATDLDVGEGICDSSCYFQSKPDRSPIESRGSHQKRSGAQLAKLGQAEERNAH